MQAACGAPKTAAQDTACHAWGASTSSWPAQQQRTAAAWRWLAQGSGARRSTVQSANKQYISQPAPSSGRAAAAQQQGAPPGAASATSAQLSPYARWRQAFDSAPITARVLGFAGAIPFIALSPPVAHKLYAVLPLDVIDNCAVFQVSIAKLASCFVMTSGACASHFKSKKAAHGHEFRVPRLHDYLLIKTLVQLVLLHHERCSVLMPTTWTQTVPSIHIAFMVPAPLHSLAGGLWRMHRVLPWRCALGHGHGQQPQRTHRHAHRQRALHMGRHPSPHGLAHSGNAAGTGVHAAERAATSGMAVGCSSGAAGLPACLVYVNSDATDAAGDVWHAADCKLLCAS